MLHTAEIPFSRDDTAHDANGAFVQIKEGDRIAQLVLERIMIAEVMQVESLNGTDRGAGGFGSTGGFGNENSSKE